MLWKEPLVELDYFKTNTSIIRTTNVLKVKYWKLGSISGLCNLSSNEVRHFGLSNYAFRKNPELIDILLNVLPLNRERPFDFKH